MQNYVVGLAFSENRDSVLLLQKKHGPECVIGRWNGVGGKVEKGELPVHAMVREFEEEAGLKTTSKQWDYLGTLQSPVHRISFYHTKFTKEEFFSCEAMTDEPIGVFLSDQLPLGVMPNLKWMIPYLLDDEITKHYFRTINVHPVEI